MLAGLFFSLVTTIGFLLCILPGIAVALVTPVFVNRIFVTDMGIGEAFSQSFQVVYRSENGLSFVGLEVLTGIVVGLLASSPTTMPVNTSSPTKLKPFSERYTT